MPKLSLEGGSIKKEGLIGVNQNFAQVPLGDKGIAGERDDVLNPRMADNYGIWEHLQRYRYAAKRCKGRILDVGCGTGYGTKMLSKEGNKVYGIDNSQKAIDYAKQNYPGPEYICCSAEKLPFENSYFDTVTAFEVIEHVQDPERTLDEIYRVLKKNGDLFISTPNLRSLIIRLKHFLFSTPYFSHSGNIYHLREFYYEEFINFLKKKNFRIISVYGQRLPIPKIDFIIKKIPFFYKIPILLGCPIPKYAMTIVVHTKSKKENENIIHFTEF